MIERNGIEVWCGPVTQVTRNAAGGGTANTIEVRAEDHLARFKRRLATDTTSAVYVNVDACSLLAEVVASAMHPYDLWTFPVPDVNVGVPITREHRVPRVRVRLRHHQGTA